MSDSPLIPESRGWRADLAALSAAEQELWERVCGRFQLDLDSDHGPAHWLRVRRNGLYLAREHGADEEVVRLFAVFHDSCRESEYGDPPHGPRGGRLAIKYREEGHFALDDVRMELLVTACNIHNGGPPQEDPTIGVCLDADRLDLGRVGIMPDPELMSTVTAKVIAANGTHELLY